MSGVITSLNVTEGNVFEGGNVYTIQDNENFIVSSSVDEYDISSIEKGMTVPYDAVTTGSDGTAAITVDADGEKKTISVKTGLETDYYTEIISDEISEGMTVYLSTPMFVTTPEGDEDMSFPGMPGGGGFPSGGEFPGGGGMPSGMPSGGPGGF